QRLDHGGDWGAAPPRTAGTGGPGGMMETIQAPGSPERISASFVIPCYNLGRYLPEAVESVLAQTRTDYELLIVDDGSTDAHTRDTLEALARRGFQVLRQ